MNRGLAAVFIPIGFAVFANAIAQGPHTDHDASQTTSTQPSPAAKKDETRVPVDVPPEQQTRIGLVTALAKKQPLEHTIRTVGTVTADQRREAHIHSKINGWIERLHVDYIGKPVSKGQALFELYSPDLLSTQEEYLAARKQGKPGREIANAALERLSLWGVPKKEIDRLRQTGRAKRTLTFESPISGYVVNKAAIQGMYITPEVELYHIADLSKVWVIVSLYEFDVAVIREGDPARVTLPYDPNQLFTGVISYIYPEIEAETRTAKARIEIENRQRSLKPGMFANVEVKKNLGESIVVPDDAVIDTGTRRIVFVKIGPTRFEPREVKVGPRVGEKFAILDGLKEGDPVVTSAHFLIDAESKFRAATEKGTTAPGGHGGHGAK